MTDANLKRRRFDPVSIGLPEEFVLTDYTRLKGCSCKLPQPKLLSLLQSVSANPGQKDVGMDCSIVPLHKKDGSKPLSLVSTTDYFFPSVEDPFLQGEIGAANVLSDLYSMGITECDTMLMLLAASTDMDENERYTTSLEMMKGFTQVAKAAGTTVTGGQTVMNPWPLIGGVAMSVVSEAEMVRPAGLMQAGDVLVLTKPLGNQIAVNLKQWLSRPSPLFLEFVKDKVTEEEVEELYNLASDNMKRLNRTAAQLMKKYRAHGATDVTGFGILGHANNFGAAQAQTETPKQLTLVLEKLPIFKTAVKASRLMKDKYKLFEGYSAETSGGLLVALGSQADAEKYVEEIQKLDGQPAWIIGKVVEKKDNQHAVLAKGYEIIEV
ncbi:selenophosphate synthetase [Angomonas deanei]|nr:selenide, water dikinase [Angomonas deanei]EPY42432.1 selenophosphate synthetase [Angomonas deanei]EPY43133.1 selenophosphate synthetase [Angomonas deanei]|eukprot:EPY37997.1 selenide, water dikinase [Angomonas deanei]